MYNNTGGQTSPSKGVRLSFLTPTDQTKFEQIFTQSAAAFGGNKIPAQAVSELLRRSNLDNDSLAKIWDLSSIANAPYLSFPEFAVAMALTSKKLTGQTLPASLPPNMREETELAMATIASYETPQSSQLVNTSIPSQPQQQQQYPMMTGMQQNMMTGMPPQQQNMMTGMPPQQQGMMTGFPSQQQNMMTGMPSQRSMLPQQTGMPNQFRPQLPQQTGFNSSFHAPIQTAMQTGYMSPAQPPKPRLQNLDFAKKMMPNQSGVTNLLNPSLGTSDANRLSWKISPEDKQRYRDIFNAWEGSGSGFMSGDTAKDVLTQSQLPPSDLIKIWNLADIENKGSLDVDEFAVAMHLMYRKLNGFEIPTELPAELKPPSSVLKKFILGRRPPPSKPVFSPQPVQEEEEEEHDYSGYTSNSRRKGPQSASSSRYASSSYDQPADEEDVLILEDLRRQIAETKRTLSRMPATPIGKGSSKINAQYSLEELKEKIRRAQDDLNQASLSNPLYSKYTQNSETLLELLETEKSLQDEINYLCNRDIPMLARQLRGAAAELRDTKVRYSRKNDGTQDFMAFIQPTGPGGSISEGDRVRAKAKAMMAARKSGNTSSSTDAAYGLRRAEEEKEEADKKADSIERDMERSRTALLDMRGDLKYLEEMIAAQDLEDKKRFENNGQELSYELRRFIEQLNSKANEPSSYAPRSISSGYQSPSVASPAPTHTPSPKPKPVAARPRTADEIKKEAERRVQERLAALQAKRNPSAASKPTSRAVPVSKPHEGEVAAQTPLDTEREKQEALRRSTRDESDRVDRERQRAEEEALEVERVRQASLDEENRRQEEAKRYEEEEKEFLERKRQVLAKEEADRQARFDAIRRDEEEAEQKKNEHKPEEAPAVIPPVLASPAMISESPSPVTSTPTPPPPPPAPPAPAAPVAAATTATGSSNNPFAKLQGGSSQAEKPHEAANKRVSYNPFAAFSAFSATKGGAKDESDSEDDGWGNDDSDDDNEFPAAGSAKNLAGKLFSAMSQRENSGSLETVSEVPATTPHENDTSIPPPPPPPSNDGGIPPPPPAPAAPAAPPAPFAASSEQEAPASGGGLRNALLGQIQAGARLKKTVTNDRSASSVAGQVIGDNSAPVQPTPAPEIAAPAPISAPLSSGNFLAELQARATGSSPEAAATATPEPVVQEEPKQEAPKSNEPEKEYIALWDYPGSGADDLIFSQDDIILVRDDSDAEDWWYGTLQKSEKTGYFPRNYVQLKPEAAPELNMRAKTLYDFDGPKDQGCLSFSTGDTVTILVKESDDWWKAKSDDGQVGLVPANYLEEI